MACDSKTCQLSRCLIEIFFYNYAHPVKFRLKCTSSRKFLILTTELKHISISPRM